MNQTDDTTAAVQKYGDRISYMRDGPNAGGMPRESWSARQARGEYVALLDSDDLVENSTRSSCKWRFLRYGLTTMGFTFSNFPDLRRGPRLPSRTSSAESPTALSIENSRARAGCRTELYRWQRSFASIKGMRSLQLPTQGFHGQRGWRRIYARLAGLSHVLPSALVDSAKSRVSQLSAYPTKVLATGWREKLGSSSRDLMAQKRLRMHTDLLTTYNRAPRRCGAARLTRGAIRACAAGAANRDGSIACGAPIRSFTFEDSAGAKSTQRCSADGCCVTGGAGASVVLRVEAAS